MTAGSRPSGTALPGAAFRWDTLTVDGLEVEYAAAGPAHALSTIVSFPGSAGIEMSIAKDLLAENLRVVEINPPGWGGRRPPGRSMSQNEMAEVLSRAVAGAVPGGPIVLLGTSAGGANALCAAPLLRPRVRGVVLEGSMAPTIASDHKGSLPETLDDARVSTTPEDMPAPRPHPRKPWATEEFFRLRRQNQTEMFRWFRTSFMPESALRSVVEERLPVLVLLGDADELIRPSQERTVRAALPHAHFRMIAGGLHDLQNTVPEEFSSEVTRFLGSLSPTGSQTVALDGSDEIVSPGCRPA